MANNSKDESRANLNLYPEKPATETGFKKAVAWFGGREMVASLKDMLMYGIFGENLDPRSWMNPNIYPNLVKKIINQKELKKQKEIEQQKEKEKKIEQQKELAEQKSPQTEKNSDGQEVELFYTAISAEAAKLVKEDKTVRADISVNIEQEWAKRIYDQWEWKRNYYEIWDQFSNNGKFWKKLQPDRIPSEKKKPDDETKPENSDRNVSADASGQTVKETKKKYLDEFWFDYISDSGDGQLGVYNVACMCLSDLWLDIDEDDDESETEKKVRFRPPNFEGLNDKVLLPRGSFLFVGGDTAYHTANYATLVERFQYPFRWAFTSVRKFAEKNYKLKPEKKTEAEKILDENLEKLKSKDLSFSNDLKGSLPGIINNVEYFDTEPTRPFLGIPANHDYYDGIDGFNRQFRRPPFENIEENMSFAGSRGKFLLQIPTFSRKQEASYIAICLPFEWWMFGIDSENEKLDFRQELYFTDIVERYEPKKLILATPEPTTVFGKKSDPDAKTATYLKAITKGLGLSQPFLTNGKFEKVHEKNKDAEPDLSGDFCRLDLSGDVHHYARYWGEDSRRLGKKGEDFHSENYASVVAGGGGAFFDVTKTLIGEPLNRLKNPVFENKDFNGEEIKGEIPPQKVFPTADESVNKTADKLFDVWNIREGGYVQYAGFAIAAILFYFLTYFSNFSKFLKDYKITFFPKYATEANHYFISICFLLAAGFLVGATAFSVHRLIENLKLRSFKERLNSKKDARMKQLAYCYIPSLFAIPCYFTALTYIFQNRAPAAFTKPLDYFLISCNLIIVFVIFFLLIWLSAEHTNWLAVRFKIVRKYKRKTLTQQFEDPNQKTNWKILKFVGFLSRLYSYQYFLSNFLIFLAFGSLVAGINIFGNVVIARTLADTVLILIIIGFAILIIGVFGYGTGAEYHRSVRYKIYFFVFGTWHYILQLATPLVLFFYGSWKFLVLNFLLVGLFNGSGFISFLIRIFLIKGEKKSEWEAIANFRIAAVMTKYFNKYVLFAVWFVYGAAILIYPLKTQAQPSVYQYINGLFANISNDSATYGFLRHYLGYFYNVSDNVFDSQFASYCSIWLSILIIGYIGYLMSRVWLGWYLAVSTLFDGHNNEAGGAARIEGFKHILRIKVEREKITVYVIGFDEARAEMSDMEMKLVDKFILTPKPIGSLH